jgi:hypothetical protein
MRCLCTRCMLEAVLRLLRSGRVGMATALLEQALRLERERAERERAERERPVKPTPRARKAGARA